MKKYNTWETEVDPADYLEKNDGTTMTEQSYIPPNIQIAQMIEAGQNLDAYRKELYDFTDEDPDLIEDYYDPTREPGYDMADASQALVELAKRAKAARRAETMKGPDVKAEGDVKPGPDVPEASG